MTSQLKDKSLKRKIYILKEQYVLKKHAKSQILR